MKSEFSLKRRSILKNSIISGACLSFLSKTSTANPKKIAKGSTVLFQGDSITDAGRDRIAENSANHPGMLGRGYPHVIAGQILAKLSQEKLKIYNRGISGNKIPDLTARWEKDCLNLKPNILSILIGVNDIWHKLNGNYKGTVQDYEMDYSELIKRTKEKLPNTLIIICEPFVLRCGAINDAWFPEFDERRAASKRVSKKFETLFVPFQKMFDEAVASGTEPEYWAGDGVHPSVAGHALMANTWINIVSNYFDL
ncbi:MAG: SGNH/GDSL hydrolase family protein [Verrucomicrobiales bacterium]|nr:SGNH/GDSL hydrolase family protein [Verrucomicrobiales bacterium]